ncbi:MAG: hypothetical protein RPU39_13630 [Candidatus Sedimenticola sp. (ex Thyasira tokunagai)]
MAEEQKRIIQERVDLAKEHAPDLINLMRESYNAGLIPGGRALIKLHLHVTPVYGLKSRRPFTPGEYDPWSLCGYTPEGDIIAHKWAKPYRTMTVISVTRKTVQKHFTREEFYAKEISVFYDGWKCRWCNFASGDDIPKKHSCPGYNDPDRRAQ